MLYIINMGGTNSKFPTKGEMKNMSKESLHELMDNIKEELKSTDDDKLKKKYRKNIKKLKEFLHVNHHDMNRHNDMDMMDHHSTFARMKKAPVRRKKSPIARRGKSPVHRKSPPGSYRMSPPGSYKRSPVGHSAFAMRRKSPVGHSAFAGLHRKSPVGHSAFSHHMDDNSSVASSSFMDDNSSVASSVASSSFFGRRR